MSEGRVEGNLNLSRAIGDLTYKQEKTLPPEKQMISALPDVRSVGLKAEDDFFVVACDGIWNVMSSQVRLPSIHPPTHPPTHSSNLPIHPSTHAPISFLHPPTHPPTHSYRRWLTMSGRG